MIAWNSARVTERGSPVFKSIVPPSIPICSSRLSGQGCELMRPAKVTSLQLHDGSEQVLTLDFQQQQRTIRARWIVDASGRAAMIARKLGHFRPNLDHPINAVWARFTGVKEWDSYEWREKFPEMANACRTSREWATNHLMGYGWWCWIIPLRGGDVSAGVVYDSRIFDLPAGREFGAALTCIISSRIRSAARFLRTRR